MYVRIMCTNVHNNHTQPKITLTSGLCILELLKITQLLITCFLQRGGGIYLKVALELAKAADLGVIG